MPFPDEITPIEKPIQLTEPQFGLELKEAQQLIHGNEARANFEVDGSGLTVAVLDTGLRTTHIDFAGRVPAQGNFTADNGGDSGNASDGNGHGTNVGGIIVANGGPQGHLGIAPGANIIPLKVLSDGGGGSFAAVDDALQWVTDHRDEFNITAVCMSLGASNNDTSDADVTNTDLAKRVRALREAGVAVVIAAGNDFFTHGSQQGMSFPAIIRECVSVGAVYDKDEGSFSYSSGATAFATAPDRVTPFSQRLHESVNPDTRTDIFAPGAPITSSGIENDTGESVQHGTSQATPVVAGVILLMQEYHLRLTGNLPKVDDLVDWMRRAGVVIHDGDDELDNVTNTDLDYVRVDAASALDTIRRALQKHICETGQALRA